MDLRVFVLAALVAALPTAGCNGGTSVRDTITDVTGAVGPIVSTAVDVCRAFSGAPPVVRDICATLDEALEFLGYVQGRLDDAQAAVERECSDEGESDACEAATEGREALRAELKQAEAAAVAQSARLSVAVVGMSDSAVQADLVRKLQALTVVGDDGGVPGVDGGE